MTYKFDACTLSITPTKTLFFSTSFGLCCRKHFCSYFDTPETTERNQLKVVFFSFAGYSKQTLAAAHLTFVYTKQKFVFRSICVLPDKKTLTKKKYSKRSTPSGHYHFWLIFWCSCWCLWTLF